MAIKILTEYNIITQLFVRLTFVTTYNHNDVSRSRRVCVWTQKPGNFGDVEKLLGVNTVNLDFIDVIGYDCR